MRAAIQSHARARYSLPVDEFLQTLPRVSRSSIAGLRPGCGTVVYAQTVRRPGWSPPSNMAMTKSITGHPVRQVAYFVPDAAAAARRACLRLPSGAYYLAQHDSAHALRASRSSSRARSHVSVRSMGRGDDRVRCSRTIPARRSFRDLYQGAHRVSPRRADRR
jgi:hypothetical protein